MESNLYKNIFKNLKIPLLIIDNKEIIDFNFYSTKLFNSKTTNDIKKTKLYKKIIEKFELNKENNFILNHKSFSYQITFTSLLKNNSVYIVKIEKQTNENTSPLLYNKGEFLQQLFNRSIFPIAILDNYEVVLDINNMFEKIFKYTREEAIGKPINELIVPGELSEESEKFKSIVFKEKTISKKTFRYDKYKNKIHVEAVGSPIVINNKVSGIFAMYNDIREEVSALKELKRQQAYFKELFYKSPDAIALLDSSNKIVTINNTFEKYFEYNINEIEGIDIDDLIVPDSHMLKAKGYSNCVMNKKDSINVESMRISKHNKNRFVEISAYPISMNHDKLGIYAIYKDISNRKEKEKRIHDMAYMDNLTKTYNRRKFYEVVDSKIFQFNNYNKPFSIIIFDIDSFKYINDTFGHLAGDKILQQISIIISQNIRKDDWLFRWGGDEFIILLSESDLDNALMHSNKIEKLITNNNFFKNINITISCGISEYHENNTLDKMLIKADKRMYKSKNQKKMLLDENTSN